VDKSLKLLWLFDGRPLLLAATSPAYGAERHSTLILRTILRRPEPARAPMR